MNNISNLTSLLDASDLEDLGDSMGWSQELEIILDSGPFEDWTLKGTYVSCRVGDPTPCEASHVVATSPEGLSFSVPEDSELHGAFELQVHRLARHDDGATQCDGHLLQGPLWAWERDSEGASLYQLPEPTPEQMVDIIAVLRPNAGATDSPADS